MGVGIGTIGRRGHGAGRLQTAIVITVVMVVIGVFSWFVANGTDDGVTSVSLTGVAAVEPPAVGKAPTPFTGLGYDGREISLAAYAGKPLWLTFGASWCRDCRVEAGDLEATYEQYRARGLNVLAVFINDPAADIASYAKRAGLTFSIVADESTTIGSAYRLVGIPTHLFIGTDGLIKEIRIGAMSKNEMEQYVGLILP